MEDIPLSIKVIGRKELRRRFDDGRYWHRVQVGDGLFQTSEEEGHPSPPPSGEPYCTYSLMLAYRADDGEQVARVHQYLRPDGSTGGAGERPDPKELLEDGVLYIVVDPGDWGGAEGEAPSDG